LYNVLLVDLRGHGKSVDHGKRSDYSFEEISKDVIDVLDMHGIKNVHFVGVSMGCIIIKQICSIRPDLVKSMIFAGAVTKLNIKSRLLLRLGRLLKGIMPRMALYGLFARIMLPRKNHKESRKLFIQEARKLMISEFNRWFRLTSRLTNYLNILDRDQYHVPQLYIMGRQDHLFLKPILELTKENRFSELCIVEDCGHIVNVERPDEFNERSIEFISRLNGFK
ncbi:MAG: alpha/beta fold hydrolase, partial [Bacteroidota bacterium]